MTAITITAETIAKLEAKGFSRWTKGNMDRLYINARDFGVRFEYYKTGNIRNCFFTMADGETVNTSNAEGYRFKATKAYIDLATGELHIQTGTDYEDEIRENIEAIIAECMPEPQTEPEDEQIEDATTKETVKNENEYVFSSANKGDVRICVTGDYYDGCKDLEVSFGEGHALCEESFTETDDASEIMGWLVANGVKFESERSALFNLDYIQSVMIDRDATESDIVTAIASLSDDVVASRYVTWIADTTENAKADEKKAYEMAALEDGVRPLCLLMSGQMRGDKAEAFCRESGVNYPGIWDNPQFATVEGIIGYINLVFDFAPYLDESGTRYEDYDLEAVAMEITKWDGGRYVLKEKGEPTWDTIRRFYSPSDEDEPVDAVTFATMSEAVDYVEVMLGEYADSFDVERIAREMTDWIDGKLTLVVEPGGMDELLAKYDRDLKNE